MNAGAVIVSQHQVSSLKRQDVFNSLEKEFHCRAKCLLVAGSSPGIPPIPPDIHYAVMANVLYRKPGVLIHIGLPKANMESGLWTRE